MAARAKAKELATAITAYRESVGLPGNAQRSRLLAMTMFFQLERVCFFRYIRGWTIDDGIIDLLAVEWYRTASAP